MATTELTSPAAVAVDGPTGVVSFPPALEVNCFQRKLYGALESHGYRLLVGHLKLGWLVRNRHRARVLHFHWPEPYYRHRPSPHGPLTWIKVALFVARLLAARALGYRIAWTIHEVYPLGIEDPVDRRVDRTALMALARIAQVRMANDPQTADTAASVLRLSRERIDVVPHSSYVDVYPQGRSRADVRDELGIGEDTRVFLIFGHISAFKQVDWWVDAFRAANLPDAALIVAGVVMDEAAGTAIEAAAAEDPRVKPLLGFIPDDRVTELFAAADVAIAPRQDGGTSAVLLLALSMGVPPVTAAAPTYESLTGGEDAGWLFTPYDRDDLIATLERAAADPDGIRERGRRGLERVAGLSWDGMARQIDGLYRGRPAGDATS
jgi:glycosyltransferase involved in cell wall biosynthesis